MLGGRIEGTITMAGVPVANGRVSIWHDDLHTSYGETESDSSGEYAIENVPEGLIKVMLKQPGSLSPYSERSASRIGVTVADGKTTRVNFAFPPGSSKVFGQVTVLGDLAEDGSVRIAMETTAGFERSATMIRDGGRFAIWDLPGGPATLIAHVRDGESEWKRKTVSIQIPELEEIEINVDFSGSAEITGRIEGLEPFENGRVMVLVGAMEFQIYNAQSWHVIEPLLQGSAHVQNDQDEYLIRGLDAGTYTVLAERWQRNSHGSTLNEPRFATALVEIKDGETQTLDFDLR